MPKNCPWCGKDLEIRRLESRGNIREVCARCGFKLREYKKPEMGKIEEKPTVVEIKDHERPIVREKPIWPIIATIIAIVIVLVILIKVFLV